MSIGNSIKGFFDVEPIQKYSIIVFFAVCFIAFMQLFTFSEYSIDDDYFVSVGLTLGVSVCWMISQIPSYACFFSIAEKSNGDFDKSSIFFFGFSLLFWMMTSLFIGYLIDVSQKQFIVSCVILQFIKFVIYFIIMIVELLKKDKKKLKK